jgi:hypothetical protein
MGSPVATVPSARRRRSPVVRRTARAIAISSAGVIVLGLALAGPAVGVTGSAHESSVIAALKPTTSGPPLTVEPFQYYRPEWLHHDVRNQVHR